MKVAFIITRFDSVGGAQIHVRDIGTELLRRGHEVHVIGGGDGGDGYQAQLHKAGIATYHIQELGRPIRPILDGIACHKMYHLLKTIRPDIVSAHSSKAGLLGRVVGRTLGFPVLFTAHGWAFTDGVSPLVAHQYMFAERAAAPLARRIITVSDFDRQLAIRYHIATTDKLITIHNGMYDVTQRADLVTVPDVLRIVMVGRFANQKDHRLLLNALSELGKYRWTLDLVGDGPGMSAAQLQANSLGLANRVRFVGHSNCVEALLAEAHLFVLASKWEGFPRSILEAMRAGLPVIASDVGGSKEAVIEGETGFLIARGHLGQLRERITQLLDNHALRQQMGRSGRLRFEDKFLFGRMFEETLAVYDAVTADEDDSSGQSV